MKTIFAAAFVAAIACLAYSSIDADESTNGPDQAAVTPENQSGAAMKPVEGDVHEFMEYAFEPFFHALKESMSAPPANKNAWKPVKANSLILAENGNLLMLRGPKENVAEWNQMSLELREQGAKLYQAAKKRDYKIAREQYEQFVSKCNACHEEFAGGEHMQKP